MTLADLVRRLDDLLGLAPAQAEHNDPGLLVPRKQGLPHRIKLGLRAAVTIGLLLWVISGIDLTAAVGVMRRANLALVPAMVALFMGERLLGSLRWYLLVRGDPRVTHWKLTRLLFTTNFAGFFLPGSVGVELLRVYSLGRSIGNLARAFSSVLVERIQALTALAVLTLVDLLSAPPGMPPEIGEAAWLGLAGMVGATLLLLWPRFRQLTLGLLPGARLDGLRAAAGLGVREAAFVYLFGLAGMPGDAAFGLAMFVYVISFSAWLPARGCMPAPG